MDSDADRLEMVRAVGFGASLKHDGRSFSVVFDADFLLAGEVEERSPVATMRSSDVADAGLQKDSVAEVFNPFDGSRKNYRVKRFEPDGTGMTMVILKAA